MENELKDQIKEVLSDGLEYMKTISKNYNILTDAISNNDEASIAKNYEDLREGLQWIEDALDNFEILMDLDYSIILIRKQSSKKIIEQYKNFIFEWEFTFNSGEYKKLSELTELELPKHIKKLISIFNKVKKIMNDKEN